MNIEHEQGALLSGVSMLAVKMFVILRRHSENKHTAARSLHTPQQQSVELANRLRK